MSSCSVSSPPASASVCIDVTTLHTSDLQYLNPHAWCNDNVISFLMEWFQKCHYQKQQKQLSSAAGNSSSKSAAPPPLRLRYVQPTVSAILMHENDEKDLYDTIRGCRIIASSTPPASSVSAGSMKTDSDANASADADADADDGRPPHYVFFPISDASVTAVNGGTHWSLLVWSMCDCAFYYFDSLRGTNIASARQLARQLWLPLSNDAVQWGYYRCGDGDGDGDAQLTKSKDRLRFFEIVDTPQQSNGYDCAVYTLALAQCIGEWVAQKVLEKRQLPSLTCDVEVVHAGGSSRGDAGVTLASHLKEKITSPKMTEKRSLWLAMLRGLLVAAIQ